MNCEQAYEAFEELYHAEGSIQDFPELEEHLEQCSECQARYARERLAVEALRSLEPLAMPPDFCERVMSQLPDAVPGRQVQSRDIVARLQEAWSSLASTLARPAARRRLEPALAIAAAVLLLLGLLYGLRGGEVHTTPGAVAGTASSWP